MLGTQLAEIVYDGVGFGALAGVFADSVEVVDLEEPDSIALIPDRAASKMFLEECQDDTVLLGHVQAQRHFPGELVVGSFAEAQVEASFAINETGKVVTD